MTILKSKVSADLMRAEIPVEGWSCGNCSRRTEQSLAESRGVESVETDLDSGQLTVEFDPDSTNVNSICEEVEKLGFSCPDN